MTLSVKAAEWLQGSYFMKALVGNHFDRTIFYICDGSPGTGRPPVGAQRGGQGAGRAGAALAGGAVQVGHQEGPGRHKQRWQLVR